jgi:flagellar biosynthesis/type III secretory pathway chaperone
MMDPKTADRWIAILRQEESHLARLIEILQSDQRAVALSRADELEENVRLKEAVLVEMQVVVEARRGLLDSLGRTPEGGARTFDEMAESLPPSHRGQAIESLARVRSLRSSLAELNELTRRIMTHGLMLVRSTLGLIHGEATVPVYGGNGDFRPASGATGRIVRQNV